MAPNVTTPERVFLTIWSTLAAVIIRKG